MLLEPAQTGLGELLVSIPSLFKFSDIMLGLEIGHIGRTHTQKLANAVKRCFDGGFFVVLAYQHATTIQLT